jgi:hypothetical protein
VVIAVDEPDKKGYATFNKAKKGVAANLPVVLVTSSVAIDAFAAHRKLKVHADEYLDKRGLSTAELLGKLDNLFGLGELTSDGELAIPVEVDEVSIDDDVLVDEVDSAALDLGDGDDFNEGAHTVHSSTGFDDLIDAETDAAFAALTDAMPIEAAQAALARTPAAMPAPARPGGAAGGARAGAVPAEPRRQARAALPDSLEPLETFESVSASLSLTDLEPMAASDAAIELPPLDEPAAPPPVAEPPPRRRASTPPPRGRATVPPPPPPRAAPATLPPPSRSRPS